MIPALSESKLVTDGVHVCNNDTHRETKVTVTAVKICDATELCSPTTNWSREYIRNAQYHRESKFYVTLWISGVGKANVSYPPQCSSSKCMTKDYQTTREWLSASLPYKSSIWSTRTQMNYSSRAADGREWSCKLGNHTLASIEDRLTM